MSLPPGRCGRFEIAMFPILLDLARIKVMAIGSGPQITRRLALLDEEEPRDLTVYADAPSKALASAAGNRLRRFLPAPEDFAAAAIVFIGDLDRSRAGLLAGQARAAGALVNVEDDKELSDFHSASIVRRGDLLLTVSTNGRSPALARQIREFLSEIFGEEWAGHLEEIAALRDGLRATGADGAEISAAAKRLIEARSWLKQDR